MKVVLNKCYGGYGLSLKGKKRLGELQGQEIYFYKQTKYNFKDKEEECRLLSLLDDLNKNNVKFALSNVFESKGKSNDILVEWSKKYNVHYLNCTYGNCNYQRKGNSETVEVLVTNY